MLKAIILRVNKIALLSFLTTSILLTSCSDDDIQVVDEVLVENTNSQEVVNKCDSDLKLPSIALGTYLSADDDDFISDVATITESSDKLYTITFNNNVAPLINIPLCGVELEEADGSIVYLYNFQDTGLSVDVISTSKKNTLVVFKFTDPIIGFSGVK